MAIMFSTGKLLQRKLQHRVSVLAVWLLLSRLLHAGGGLVSLGTQQTPILSFQKLCDNCWKECLSHLVEILHVISHDALQLLVSEMYLLVCWAVKGSKLVVKVT